MSANTVPANLVVLEKEVFIYDGSQMDKRFFKQKIIEFVQQPQTQTFTQYMWQCIWHRNEQGRTTKYLDFNERNQRLSIEPNFYTWMVEMIKLIEITLKPHNR